MTPEQVRGFVMDALSSHPPREVSVTTRHGEPPYIGEVHFAGANKFRLDHPLGALFFTYDEVFSVE
jgi:hypothetical protein